MLSLFLKNSNPLRVLTMSYQKLVEETSKLKLFILWLVLYAVPDIPLIVLSILFSIRDWNLSCDGTMMPLPIWLVVNASVCGFVLLITFTTIFFKDWEFGSTVLINTLATSGFFILAWNVVGAVALFRDSKDCKEEATNIWILVLAILIIQWVVMFVTFCGGWTVKRVHNKEEAPANNPGV